MKSSSNYNTIETYQNTRTIQSTTKIIESFDQCKSLNQNYICLSPAYYNLDTTPSPVKTLSPIISIFSPQQVVIRNQ